MRFDQEEVFGRCRDGLRRRKYFMQGYEVEKEEEMDKIDFFCSLRSEKMVTRPMLRVWGSKYSVQKWHSKLKGKVTDTVGWKNQRLGKS